MTAGMDFLEQVIFSLRQLYDRRGYIRYKMSKFEEYDLYARNKDFLVDRSVITFMDTNGSLMALKPDVTLSIVKNSRDDGASLQKLYYNENVYRVSKSTRRFRELMQVGLECLGRIDDYCICEVLTLAAQSLRVISPDCVLDISHLGLLDELLDSIGIPEDQKATVLRCIGQKNTHELTALCRTFGIPEEKIVILKEAVSLSGSPDSVLPQLKTLLGNTVFSDALNQLCRIMDVLTRTDIAPLLRFDFSAVDDIRYYNGIVFKGYIQGLPGSVLSGGQYDRLMEKMGRRSGAMGFAVYMDALERLDLSRKEYDADTVLLYKADTPLDLIQSHVEEISRQGKSVLVLRQLPENLRCRAVIQL
jgi:ATP phosphoribosyltransferase regulatory subunit